MFRQAYNSQPQEQELIKRGNVIHIPIKEKEMEKGERRDQGYNSTLLKSKKSFYKKMGRRKNKFMTQQIQEAVNKV